MARTDTLWFRATPKEVERAQAVAARYPAARTQSDLNVQLWLRGLLLAEAQAVAAGAPLPRGMREEVLATAIAQELLAVLPLLRRTGRLALLGLELELSVPMAAAALAVSMDTGEVDAAAAADVADMGGDDFL
jgi:hypothetical protein